MSILDAVRTAFGGSDVVVVQECRHCGTAVDGGTTECPRCGTTSIVRYEIR